MNPAQAPKGLFPAPRAAETDTLAHLGQLITVVSEHVRTRRLGAFRLHVWAPEGKPTDSRGQRWLTRLYFARDAVTGPVLPTSIVLTLLLMVSLQLDPVFPTAFALFDDLHLTLFGTLKSAGSLLALVGLVALMTAVVLYTVLGGYWTFGAVLLNRSVSKPVRVFIFLVAALLTGWWLFAGAPRIWYNWQLSDPLAQQMVASLPGSQFYLVASAILFYIPVLGNAALWVTKVVSLVAAMIAALARWLLVLHTPSTPEAMVKFIQTPLPAGDAGGMERPSLLCLTDAELAALREWAEGRRKTVQGRLIPITLALAFLGILVDAKLADPAIAAARSVVETYFASPASPVQQVAAYGGMVLLIALLMFPTLFLVNLLNESYVADYTAEMCVLARHAKCAEDAAPAHEPARRRKGALARWLESVLK